MNISDTELLYLTGYSVLLGVSLAVCYGIFSFVRILVSPVRPESAKGRAICDIAAFITDVLYSLFAGVCVALMFFGLNSGRVRLLGILGCVAGFSIYHFTLGRFIIDRFTRVVGAVRAAIGFVYCHTVGYAVRAISGLIKRLFIGIWAGHNRIKREKKRKRKVKHEKLEFLG